MASAVIGALRVNLGIDTAQFTDGLGVSQKRLDDFAKKAAVGVAAVATAAGAAAGVLAVGVKRTVDQFAEMSRAADVANASIVEFQKWGYAAKAVGIENEKLSDILKDVNDRVGDFWATGGGPMLDFFEQIAPKVGVTAEAFRNLSGPQALQLYYDTLVKAGASQQDLTFYMEAMASDATKLIPLLADGGKRFAELGNQAERLGIIINDETAAAAKAFSQNLEQLTQVTDGFYTILTAELLPVLELASERLIELSKDTDLVDRSAGFLVDSLKFVSNEVGQLAILGARLSSEFEGIAKAFDLIGNGDFSGAWKAFQEGQNASSAIAANIRKEVEAIFDNDVISQGGIQRRIDGAFGEVGTQAGKTFLTKFAESSSDTAALEEAALRMQEDLTAFQTSLLSETEAEHNNYALRLLELQDFLDAKLISQYEFNEMEAQLATDHAARMGEIARSMTYAEQEYLSFKQQAASDVVGLLGMVGGKSKAAAVAAIALNKGLMIAQTIQNTAAAAVAAVAPPPLGLGPVAGLALAAKIKAFGALQIATIASSGALQAAGAIRGGSFSGSGGGGGERVRPDNDRRGGGGAGASQATAIHLHGQSYTQESVEDLIKALNEAAADGHKIVVTKH